MSENKFTPGPWIVRKWDGDNWPEKRISIASKYNGEALFINARYANDVNENANLISAAPELLEALEFLLDSLGALANKSELHGWMEEEDQEKIWKAIAKAKGE